MVGKDFQGVGFYPAQDAQVLAGDAGGGRLCVGPVHILKIDGFHCGDPELRVGGGRGGEKAGEKGRVSVGPG